MQAVFGLTNTLLIGSISIFKIIYAIISCSSKIQNGLPFWYRLTQVVLEKRSLNWCSSSSGSSSSSRSYAYVPIPKNSAP